MDNERGSVFRDALALVIVAFACPLAVLAQWFVGCSGQGINAGCSTDSLLISPFLLVVAGVVAGVATRGWTGLLVAYVGGVIATFWFMTPVTLGYGLYRLVWHLNSRRKGSGPES